MQQHYEFDLAVAVVSRKVAEELRRLAQQLAGNLDPAIFETCAAAYVLSSQERFQRLTAREEQNPALFEAVQQRVLKQAVRASTRERLEKLRTDGIISRATLAKLAEELEATGDAGPKPSADSG